MTTLQDVIMRMSEKYPAPPESDEPVIHVYYCRECNDNVQVKQPGDLCPKCQEEKARGYQGLMKLGRLAIFLAGYHR